MDVVTRDCYCCCWDGRGTAGVFAADWRREAALAAVLAASASALARDWTWPASDANDAAAASDDDEGVGGSGDYGDCVWSAIGATASGWREAFGAAEMAGRQSWRSNHCNAYCDTDAAVAGAAAVAVVAVGVFVAVRGVAAAARERVCCCLCSEVAARAAPVWWAVRWRPAPVETDCWRQALASDARWAGHRRTATVYLYKQIPNHNIMNKM